MRLRRAQVVAKQVACDGQEVRANGLLTNAIASRPRAHERVSRQVLGTRDVPGQEQREAEDIRVVAFVQIAEAVHAVYSDTRRVRKGYLSLSGRVIAWTPCRMRYSWRPH